MVKISEINIPEYDVSGKIDYKKIGKKIDAHIKKHHKGQRIVIRSVSGVEHSKPLDDLLEDIKIHGTDRIDENRDGRGYADVECDFFGTYHEVNDGSIMTETPVKKFYQVPVKYGKPPIRIDLIMIYDADHVQQVLYEKNSQKRQDAFKFKRPEKKQESLKHIIKIKS